ncbi:MAG TPA: extracellular solute-binding protein [Alphaproteobacteria bacterium]|nr:extracellular solute-binding protein [Alphaproteobacteria bacterium]
MNATRAMAMAAILLLAGAALAPPAHAEETKLTIFAAGTLAVPFRTIDRAFEAKNANVAVQPQFGGSVKMAKQITELHMPADILAVADYNVIPKYLFGANGKPRLADWYVGFARNAITFVYTPKSKFASEIDAKNWYKILARRGVEIGRSDPDTDPSGYQTVQMLALAAKYYHAPGLASSVLANAPLKNMRDTETSLIAALQLGQIDYLAIYRSDALQHRLKFLDLPSEINLSDPTHAAFYKTGIAHTKNGALEGKPIVYALTIPSVAPHPALAAKYIAYLLGPEGRKVLAADGFGTFEPAYAVGTKVPAAIHGLTAPWPSS